MGTVGRVTHPPPANETGLRDKRGRCEPVWAAADEPIVAGGGRGARRGLIRPQAPRRCPALDHRSRLELLVGGEEGAGGWGGGSYCSWCVCGGGGEAAAGGMWCYSNRLGVWAGVFVTNSDI